MKNLVVLYCGGLTAHAFEKVFDGKSAFEKVLDWAEEFRTKIILFTKTDSLAEKEISSILAASELEILSRPDWSKSLFISEISSCLKKQDCNVAVVAWGDTPFLNKSLSDQLLEMHEKYAAEYSFADGFPAGLAPEIIDFGACSILAQLSENTMKGEGEKPVDREAIFSVMRGDINSFEIETLIADEDYRLLRFDFEASSKINFLSCRNLYELAVKENVPLDDAYALSKLAASSASVMQTVPAFYNIQISSKYNHTSCYSLASVGLNPQAKDFMDINDFKKIIAQIRDYSENSVVSLSAFGEPLLNPSFVDFALEVLEKNDGNHRISLLIESDGLLVSDEMASKISAAAKEKNAEVNWIIYIDAVEQSLYSKIHSCQADDFQKALCAVPLLEKYFEKHVYPQFMRMKSNEEQLEAFYRFWNEKTSPSMGEFIIQKYNSFCSALPELKSADLSPVNRLPCWHLRRDMTILADGSVPFCSQLSFPKNAGNILSDGIEKVWSEFRSVMESHLALVRAINEKGGSGQTDGRNPAGYDGIADVSDNKCGICDESYTFNF